MKQEQIQKRRRRREEETPETQDPRREERSQRLLEATKTVENIDKALDK